MSEPQRQPDTAAQVLDDQHTLVLVKDGQRFIFRCARGEERALLAQLSQMACDADSPIEWTDAALICQQLGKRLNQRLAHLLEPNFSRNPGPHA